MKASLYRAVLREIAQDRRRHDHVDALTDEEVVEAGEQFVDEMHEALTPLAIALGRLGRVVVDGYQGVRP